MTASSKQVSRWGSLLQQAVAGVESRLDNILADGIEESPITVVTGKASTVQSSGASSQQEISESRSAATTNKSNDSLQERLARAVAAKNVGQKKEALPSGTSSNLRDLSTVTEETPNCKITKTDPVELNGDSSNHDPAFKVISSPTNNDEIKYECTPQQAAPLSNRTSDLNSDNVSSDLGRRTFVNLRRSSHLEQLNDLSVSPTSALTSELTLSAKLKTIADYEALVQKQQAWLSASETQRLEDAHQYIEKIDALQCKLKYLAKESAEHARLTSTTALSGSLEKKLADKELQVALLLDEGQSLSKKELTNLATIKKLKNQIKEDGKEANVIKKKLEAAQKDATYAIECRKRIQDYEKQSSEQLKLITQLQNDHNLIQSENEVNKSLITSLRASLGEFANRESKVDTEQICESLQIEKKRVADLENIIAKLEIEKNLEIGRAHSQVKELKEKMNVIEERARIVSLEMKTEQQILENKLEAMTAKAEEVSSGAAGDARARLLRQIETLQSQYSVSNENWRRIEASLVARANNAEKERDEVTRKENETRRKARDANLKSKHMEEELLDLRARVSTYQLELSDCKLMLETLQKRADKAEIELREARTALENEKKALKLDEQNQLIEEKQKWLEEITSSVSINHIRGDLPLPSRKSLSCGYTGLQNEHISRASTRSVTQESVTTPTLFNHRASTQLFRRPSGLSNLSRKASGTSLKEDIESGLLHSDHDSENGVLSTYPFNNVNEIASESFAGAAGPSVQLVERMSLTVRRLECEKVTMKEDIARLSNQRNEARTEIVCLMKELEAKKNIDKKFKEMEKEFGEVKERYETMLLMLGEKSEEVDELRGDIQDIKSMYRDLVERTVV